MDIVCTARRRCAIPACVVWKYQLIYDMNSDSIRRQILDQLYSDLILYDQTYDKLNPRAVRELDQNDSVPVFDAVWMEIDR